MGRTLKPSLTRFALILCWLAGAVQAEAQVASPRSTARQPASQIAPITPAPAAAEDDIVIYFSPHGGCTDAIVREIDNAQKYVRVQAYSFTSVPITKAIIAAKRRGVQTIVVLDRSQQSGQYSGATPLFNAGVSTFIDARHAIAHNKIVIVDGHTLITGSFNFSKAAEESNAENVLILRDKPKLLAAYERNFDAHLEHSSPYTPPSAPAAPNQAPAEPTTRPASASNTPMPATPAPLNGPAASGADVYVTRSGKKYHAQACRFSQSATAIPLSQAKQEGYTACSVCRPPL